MVFIYALRSEQEKTKHTSFWAIHFCVPVMGALLFLAYYSQYKAQNDIGNYDNVFSGVDKRYCWSERCTGRKGFTLPNAACCTKQTQKYACKINLSL